MVGEDHNFPLPAAECSHGGMLRWLPPPPPQTVVTGEDHNPPLLGRQAHAGVPRWGPGDVHKASTGVPPGIQRVGVGQGAGQGSGGKWRGPVGLPREQWRRGSGSGPPLTGASSGAQGNPSRKGLAPPRRLHGRASSEVT